MWPGAALLVFFTLSPIAAQIQIRESACLIEGASHAGGRLWLVCEEGKVLAGSPSQDGWTQTAVPARSPLRDIAFLDERRGFIVGDRGLILASEDGGKSWREVKAPTEENLTAVFFRGERGWAAGWSGVVLHSADGGRSWQLQKTGISQGLEGIYSWTTPADGRSAGWARSCVPLTVARPGTR